MNNTFVGNSDNGIELRRSDDCTISNNTCSNNNDGIFLEDSDDCAILNNTCENNYNGIYIKDSRYCTISSNICSLNSYKIIYLDHSDGSIITDNLCENNSGSIYLWHSNYAQIMNNTCSSNGAGIYLDESSDCVITNNIIKENNKGITLVKASQNNIAHYNYICNNKEYGIYASLNNYAINATNNSWSDNSGPYHSIKNSEGKGDRITDNVEFDPWIVKPNAKPTVTITSPENGATLNGTIIIKGTASDPDGTVETVDILVDGEWFQATGTTTWEFELDTTKLENWDYMLNVLAFDGTDYSEDALLNITVANEKEDDGGDGDGFLPGFEIVAVVVVAVVVVVVGWFKRKKCSHV